MKTKLRILFIILFYFFSLSIFSETLLKSNIRVVVTNLKDSQGYFYLVLFDSQKGYEKKWKLAVLKKRVKVKGKTMILWLKGVSRNKWYGIRCFQDVNSNKKLDTGFFGIPKEPFGFSNNPKLRFGPPKWKDIRFRVLKESHNLNMKMKVF